MAARVRQQNRRDATISSLNAAIEAMNIAKDALSPTPAKAVVGSVGVVLTMIRVSFLVPLFALISRRLMCVGFHD